jgi:hypothetical protein
VTETDPNAEYHTLDNMEMLVQEAELWINMTEEEIQAEATDLDITVDEYRQWRQKKIFDYRCANPDDLNADQRRRLFGQEAPR